MDNKAACELKVMADCPCAQILDTSSAALPGTSGSWLLPC